MEKIDSQSFGGIMHGIIAWAGTGRCKKAMIYQDIFLTLICTLHCRLLKENASFLYLGPNLKIFKK